MEEKTDEELEEDTYQNRMERERKKVIKIIAWTFIGIFVLFFLFGTIYTISAGYRGVLLTFGKPDMVAQGEGLHFKLPLVQKIVKMQVQTQKYEAELTASSSDLQDVRTKIAINYHISPESAPIIYRDIGIDYSEKVIYPLEQEANKAATAKYTAEQLITQRDSVRTEMKTLLTERLQPRGIIVEEISIVNFAFSDVFTQAIENKVTAEQNALAAKNKLSQIEYEAQQRIAQAEGESKAIELQAKAITSQGGAAYVQLQSINKWNGQLPVVMGSGAMPFIDMRSLAGAGFVASSTIMKNSS